MAKKVNEVALLSYFNKCHEHKANIVHNVEQTMKPALLAVGVTNEEKIKFYVDAIVEEQAQAIDSTINLLAQFIVEVEETTTEVQEGE